MIYVTGDIHGSHDISKLGSENESLFAAMTKSDYVIICGDFGLIWDNGYEDRKWRDWLDRQNYTTLFVDGNHENFDILNSYISCFTYLRIQETITLNIGIWQ